MADTARRIVSPESHVSSTIRTRLPRTSFGALPNTSGASRELAPKDCRYHRAWNHSGRSDPDYDLGIVGPCHLQGQPARQLAEERPFDFENAFGGVDRVFAR